MPATTANDPVTDPSHQVAPIADAAHQAGLTMQHRGAEQLAGPDLAHRMPAWRAVSSAIHGRAPRWRKPTTPSAVNRRRSLQPRLAEPAATRRRGAYPHAPSTDAPLEAAAPSAGRVAASRAGRLRSTADAATELADGDPGACGDHRVATAPAQSACAASPAANLGFPTLPTAAAASRLGADGRSAGRVADAACRASRAGRRRSPPAARCRVR